MKNVALDGFKQERIRLAERRLDEGGHRCVDIIDDPRKDELRRVRNLKGLSRGLKRRGHVLAEKLVHRV
jgi:hypothetical protein